MACVLIAIALLIMSNVSLYEARKSKTQVYQSEPKPMLSKEMDKRAILWIASLYLYLCAVSQPLSMSRQLEIVADLTSSINERVVLFSLRDLSIGLVSRLFSVLQGQRKERNPRRRYFDISHYHFPRLFLVISVLPSLFTVMAAVVIFKSYNYALVRPARELFYLKTPSLGYFKNSIDSILYRGGDLLAIWLIYMIKFLGFSEWTVFFIMMPVLLVWWSVSSKIQHQIKPIKMNRRDLLKYLSTIGLSYSIGLNSLNFLSKEIIKRKVGLSNTKLPIVGLGTWQTFDVGNNSEERKIKRAVLEKMVEMGASVIDSSPMYGSSERVVGDLSHDLNITNRLFMATKVWDIGKVFRYQSDGEVHDSHAEKANGSYSNSQFSGLENPNEDTHRLEGNR